MIVGSTGGLFIGIDLGGTNIRAVLTDEGGAIIARRAKPTVATEGVEAVFGKVVELAGDLRAEARELGREVRAIGIGAPGPLDQAGGRILITENLPFVDFPIVSRLEKALGLPVSLDNDANVATLGEYLLGAGRDADPLLYVTLSTGIGAGAIIGGRLLRGRSSNALEAGHMTLEPEGPPCSCGNHGCAEALASGRAIAAAASKAAMDARSNLGPPTSLSTFPALDARIVFAEASRGDPVSQSIVERALAYIGICVANLATVFDPERIVIGGGVAKAGPILIDAITTTMRARCSRTVAEGCLVLPAALGEDSGSLGAAALAWMSLDPS